ncbi:MAG: hypothetical protein O3A85_09670 [Proteobacteria bacterium]|nr:hypothetical protein [Pseudomonadota bacterium]
MQFILTIPEQSIRNILRTPEKPVTGTFGSNKFRLRVAISDYGKKIADYYDGIIGTGIDEIIRRTCIPFDFTHFGMIIEFDAPQEIEAYDQDFALSETVKDLLRQFGPLIIRNAYMSTKCRAEGQRNIFPDLRFHIDRGSTQDNQYSLFCRDPFDAVQKAPRTSSTLLVANIVGYLQALKEGQTPSSPQQTLYTIFNDQDLTPLLDQIILHQPWAEPEATGEICILDNRTILHASYYREAQGYPIGVRYLY